jgi:tetratricopeptide (TPR) repeat protein
MTIPITSTRISARLLAGILMLLVAVTFARAAFCEFINMDDNRYVTDNPRVRGGLTPENIAWGFAGDNNPAGLWIPLTWISLQIDASLSGQENPAPKHPLLPGSPPPFPSATVYHIDNIFLQMLTVAALFLALDQVTRLRWPAFFIAAFWAIHPLRVESIAWVTERKDILAGLFGFLSVLAYARWTRGNRWVDYAAAAIAMLLSTMAKPLFVTLPLLLILLDFWPLERLRSPRELPRRVLEKWIFWIIAAGVSIVTVQQQHKAIQTLNHLGIGERISRATVSYVQYLVRHVRVWDLTAYYPFGPAPSIVTVIASAIVLLAITALAIHQRRRRAWLLVGWLWYVFAMLPMSGFIQSGAQAYADRFTYLPSVGLFIVAIFAARELWQKFPRFRKPLLAAAILAATSIAFTIRQTTYWQDTETLGTRTLALTTDNWFMHEMMAIAYLRDGEHEKADYHFRKCIAINPNNEEAMFSTGLFHLQWGKLDDAAAELAKAAAMAPNDAHTHFYHGLALEKTHHPVGAILEYRNAAILLPHDPYIANYLRRAMEDPAALQEAIKYAPDLKDRFQK